MELKEIEYFVAIAEEGNLTRASERLYLSQPAMSKFLAKLEDSYKTKLFTRKNNTLKLTPAGQIYLAGAKQIQEIANNIDREILDISKSKFMSISIGVTGERTQRYLGKLLPIVYERFPDLHVDIVEFPAQILRRMLKNDEIDLGIYAIPERDEALAHTIISDEEVVLAVHSSHRLFNFGSETPSEVSYRVSLEELQNDAFVLLRETTSMRAVEDRFFAQHSFSPKKTVETKGTFSSLIFVENGFGIGFCPKNYSFSSKDIRYIGLKEPFFYTSAIMYKRGVFLTTPMKFLLSTVKQNTIKF